jgi:hypothetical protein
MVTVRRFFMMVFPERVPVPFGEDAEEYAEELKSSVRHRRMRGPAEPRKRGFAGKPCLAFKEDGHVCGTIISSYNPEDAYQACIPCLNHYAVEGYKFPWLNIPDPKTGKIPVPTRRY